ncbi:MAG TPA: protein kinase [Gemmataceae bacterium]|jgi:serine/threonine protein kinase/Tfp pilus assembly protein PilF|nr:protein kinase [Gemmataceae bacterium]
MLGQKSPRLHEANSARLHSAPAAGGLSPVKPADSLATLRVDDLHIHVAAGGQSEALVGNFPQVPGYEILEIMGEGSTGVVFKARQLSLNRLVALKMIACDHFGDTASQRFGAEAQVIARLHHPNFVQVFEVGECQGRTFLVLELVEGGTLRDLLSVVRPMPVREAVKLVAELARAMQFAHEKGVVHRDLKPANVLLSKGADVSRMSRDASPTIGRDLPLFACKITDFGLAKILDASQARTRTGVVLGTPAYMAPEQALGCVEAIGPATDVYALGVILYEMVVGRVPFAGENSWDVLGRIVDEDPEPPSRHRLRLARDLDTICLKALAKDPARRYASAADLAADLERFDSGESIEARPELRWQRFVRQLRKRPFILAASVFLAGMILFFAGLFFQQHREARAALNDGRQLRHDGNWSAAIVQLKHGQQAISPWPGCTGLRHELNQELRMAQAGQWATELHLLADRMRFRQDLDSLSPELKLHVARQCRQIFDARSNILELRDVADAAWETQIVRDLFDVALLGSRLEEGQGETSAGDGAAVRIAQELENSGANLAVLAQLKDDASRRAGLTSGDAPGQQVRTAWDHYVMGRTFRIWGDFSEAAKHLDRAISIDPRAAIFHFEAGLCASQQHNYLKAQQALTTCIALVLVGQPDPHRDLDVCYYNRALANVALGQFVNAQADLTQALSLNSSFGAAWYHRGLLARKKENLHAAELDFKEALRNGFAPGRVHYELAAICRTQGDLSAALKHAQSAQLYVDCPPGCAQLEQDLRKQCQEQHPNQTMR